MNFQVGKLYRTRSGLKALITRKEPAMMWAYIHEPAGRTIKMHYFADGNYHSSVQTVWDLVAEWDNGEYLKRKIEEMEAELKLLKGLENEELGT